ncbi:MAG: glucose-6-phosphate isomerase [Methylacidiphilales bacterium]|nr:glucose-6-phosphate isomerase [Candidatus Methylacidiphilales bacterium]MDW8349855.1 glucose-6-phosphate isomerase [Verrucomicrobiae bacterium]
MKIGITYDFNGLRSERIGATHGITPKEWEALKPRLVAAHRAILQLRQSQQIGFLDLPYDLALADHISKIAKKIRNKFDTFVVIGIGGSALGNIALHTALRHPYHNEISWKKRGKVPTIHVPDNIDPDRLAGLLDTLDLKKTFFNVISKSGDTVEIMSIFMWIKELLFKKLGPKKARRHFLITTDPQHGSLRAIAEVEGFETLPIPSNVGGRFSVLSAVGLLSASVSGIDIHDLLSGAAAMERACMTAKSPEKNPALTAAGYHYLMHTAKNKNIQIMMPYAHALKDIADWFRQLWAESLGKAHNRKGQKIYTGQTPCKSLGVTDQHSQLQLYMEGPYDKVITFLSTEKFHHRIYIPETMTYQTSIQYLAGHTLNELLEAEYTATQLALQNAQRPTCAIKLSEISPRTVGALLMLLELQTAYAGELYDINAFDQPGVEAGKQYAYGLMGREGYEAKAKEVTQAPKPKSEFLISL